MRIKKEELPYANRRLWELIEEKTEGNVKKFSEMICFSPQRINRLFFEDKRSGNYPRVTDEVRATVTETFGLDWGYFIQPPNDKEIKPMDLLKDEFEKSRNDVSVKVDSPISDPLPDDVPGGIPLIPTYAIAGYLSGEENQFNLWECERYIIPMFRKASFLIRVNGDSMQPRYFSGDLLACAKVPLNDIWFDYGSVYVVDTKQGALVKVIKKGDDSDHITLVSFNPEYEPYQLHKRELNGVAKVVGLIRAE
jgi:phage repressor protein C with HTH and peptisase S24 domain